MSTPPSAKLSASPAQKSRLSETSPNRVGTTASSGQGLARNPSLRSARPIRKAAARSSIGTDTSAEDDISIANAQIIADLKEQVERAEQASQEYRKQLEALQKRLDEVSNEVTLAEEKELQHRTQIDKLVAEVRDNARQKRELELSYESEKKLLLQDRESKNSKEAEMQSIVSRLTETLKLKNQELANTGKRDISHRTQQELSDLEQDSIEGDGVSNQDYYRILEQKNSIIESLRLEIADSHVRMAEQEHRGDGRSHILEKELLDLKMRTARLQEENESFQMLLSEKTLKGDFMHDQASSGSFPLSSLAEELETAEEPTDVPSIASRKLEIENRTLKNENKALTLYIDKIIGRLLKHDGFERIITDDDDDDDGGTFPYPQSSRPTKTEKALPDLPPKDVSPAQNQESNKSNIAPTAIATATSAAAGLLQRARSVVSRPTGPKARPLSYAPSTPTANENPETAPSIPINRSHRRARSDQADDTIVAAAIHQPGRGSPLRAASGGVMSPLNTATSNRMSYTGAPSTGMATSRVSSGPGQMHRPVSSSNSMASEHSQDLELESTDASSTRASIYSATGTALPGAVMKQNQLRPLRLVQEKAQADEDIQKKANRGSWMGWFNKGPNPAPEDPPHQ